MLATLAQSFPAAMAPGVMASLLSIFMSHIFLTRDNLKSDKIARVLGVANGNYLQFGILDVFAKVIRLEPWEYGRELSKRRSGTQYFRAPFAA
jgi:hypothetical protein